MFKVFDPGGKKLLLLHTNVNRLLRPVATSLVDPVFTRLLSGSMSLFYSFFIQMAAKGKDILALG